jgi:hypothetical protein
MTKLTRPVRRLLGGEGRALVVSLEPPGVLVFRESRTRRRYTLGLKALFVRAVMAEVEAERGSRKRRRQPR